MEDQSIMISKPWAPFPIPLSFKSLRSISASAVSAKRDSPVWELTTVTVPETGDEEAVTGREPEEKDSPAAHEAETPAAHEAEPAPAAAQE